VPIFLVVLIAAAAAIAATLAFRKLLREREEYMRVRALFSRYVPVQVIDDLLARKDPRLFEAREYYATIVSCRVRNFALVTEHLAPEEALRYLNEFYTLIGGAVQRHRGMIESLRGDTVTAVFGVLVEEQFQEERALRAALDVLRLTKAMSDRWRAQGRKPLEISVGINSGKIVAGDTGYQLRRDYAIVGNPAHVAASLQSAAEELNATIVASESTYGAVRELFVGVPVASLPLRGLRRLEKAYIILGMTKRAADDDLLRLPSERLFKQTVVKSEPPPQTATSTYSAPEVTATEYTRREPAPERSYAFESLAPLEHQRFSAFDDDKPAMPEAPVVAGVYEDDDGPPIHLNP
jgi:class 3 adenylate cyclase